MTSARPSDCAPASGVYRRSEIGVQPIDVRSPGSLYECQAEETRVGRLETDATSAHCSAAAAAAAAGAAASRRS